MGSFFHGTNGAMSSSTTDGSPASRLERLRNGDESALAELFGEYRERLHHIVSVRMDRRLTGRVDADDVLQEVYIDAADRIQHYVENHSGSFFVWLRLVATQTMANIFRRHLDAKKRDAKREVSIHNGPSYESATSPIAMQLLGRLTSPSHAAIRKETVRELEEAIGSMKPMDREIISLRHFEQLSNSEIAEVLDIGEKAASIRYVRAIARLKSLMEGMSASDNEASKK